EVGFEVPEGQTWGLVGANGSGKTTLLKIIGGILRPTEGRVVTRGRIAALLELGAGFHPELTGRENVYLNASILGLSRKETDRYFDDIVGFAELEDFIDSQVKYYSSGMFVRLGFAVAVHVDPRILLIDEVLAVGDEAFQRKCIERVRELQRQGRTIVFVTHAVQQVHQICDGAVMLDHGRIRAMGEVADVIREYRLVMAREHIGFARQELTRDVEIIAVETLDAEGSRPTTVVQPGAGMRVQVEVRANRPVNDPVISLAIFDANGQFMWRTGTADMELGRVEGKLRVEFNMIALPLQEGRYLFTIGVHDRSERVVHDLHDQRYPFDVTGMPDDDNRVFIPVGTKVDRL
ncbi:MAG TPA: ABC transporter ATP-binding protein, partial [Actinomycetota bacterium]|nr:ABC transporter ATP-binding protein [Actinomycetota bacterium]